MQRKIESLQDAAKAGDLEAAQKMLDDGADVNGKDAKEISPLGVAVGFNKVAILKLFLEANADVEQTDPKGNTALHYAAGKHFSIRLFIGIPKMSEKCLHCSSKIPFIRPSL